MGITLLPDAPFYTGGALSDLVPSVWPCAINGRPYLIDRKHGGWKHESVPLLRQQADQSDAPSDRSVNPESLWRRTSDDWSGGAGQTHRDRDGSNPARFRKSFGVDVWTEGQVSLLPAVDEKRSSSASNLFAAVAGSRLYISDDQTVAYATEITSDSPTFTAVTATHASAVTGLVSTGYRVLIGCSDGIYRTHTGTGAAEKWSSLVTTALAYVKGRVMAAGSGSDKHKVYNVTSDLAGGAIPYAAPSSLFDHPDANFTWVGFAGGDGNRFIYAAGYSGDKSQVYRIGIKEDGTGLDAPVPASPGLPDGEIVRAIDSYLGQILIGTDRGVRFATPSSAGDLTIGALLETGVPCRCFEGQGPHVWFGWEGLDITEFSTGTSTLTGLGRLSLEEFADADRLAPAYASDLMVSGSGSVTSVVTFGGLRFFGVAADGFYAEETSVLRSSGVMVSGQIDYRLPDEKVAVYLSVQARDPGDSTHYTGLAVDGGTPVQLVSTADGRFNCNEARGRSFEWTLALLRDPVATTSGPTVYTVVVEGYPTTRTARLITVPVILADTFDVDGEIRDGYSPTLERSEIRSLRDSRDVIVLQEYADRYSVVVDDWEWEPERATADGSDVCGTLVVKMKEL